MGLRIKNFNIMGVHRKIRFFAGGGVHEKLISRGNYLKEWGRAGTVGSFKGWQGLLARL